MAVLKLKNEFVHKYHKSSVLQVSKKFDAQYCTDNKLIKFNKVLLLHKISRLDLEKLSHPELSENELEVDIRKRGLDYETLVKNNKINNDFQKQVNSAFTKFGISVKNVNRFNCTPADIDWCDAVVPIGGDGTYLHAARYILNRNKPVIGFNSDPSRSEGFLCLPKKYSSDISSAIKKLIDGKYKWMFRTRIRINIIGDCAQTLTELHDVRDNKCKLTETVGTVKTPSNNHSKVKHKLPILALNEVFMSEVFAAKVSYFEMRLNNNEKKVKIKSSGLCVCTGTGSTSWHLSINSISRQDIHNILKIYLNNTNSKIDDNFEELVTIVSNNFNEKLKFGPEESRLGYTIRDLISLGVWPSPKGVIEPRGFANTIEVKSKCLDAAIIIDGGVSFPFNEGAVAFLETRPEDALRTVVLLD